jgi:hypothetical protein
LIARRTQDPLTAEKLVEEVAFSGLDWPGKTVRLERDTVQDYLQRPASAQPSIAELYHENSMLFSQMAAELGAARLPVNAVRNEFMRRRAATLASGPPAELIGRRRVLCTQLVQAVPLDLFYAVELVLAQDGQLAAHEPMADRLALVKRLSAGDVAAMASAIHLLDDSPALLSPALFVLGNFARNDLLYGVRGYRRTLLEAGSVTQVALALAHGLGLTGRAHFEFADRALNGVLEADGVEVGILVCIELGDLNDQC